MAVRMRHRLRFGGGRDVGPDVACNGGLQTCRHLGLFACLGGAYLAVVFAALSGVIIAVSLSGMTSALAAQGGRTMTPGEARMGTLLFKGRNAGTLIEAPRLASDIDIKVTGPIARGTMTQHFHNPTEGFVEAVYVMPLAENAAVDSLKMIVGERVIIGRIKERGEAKRIYERARANGKKASLLTQERPNIFTQQVANIGPGETIVVQTEWQQTIPFDRTGFRLRVPLVVAPRYSPPPLIQTVDFSQQDQSGQNGWGKVLDPVPDRARITPPVLDPERHAPTNPVTLRVVLDAGFEIAHLKSHHHAVTVKSDGPRQRIVRLTANAEPADRDFELTWTARSQPVVQDKNGAGDDARAGENTGADGGRVPASAVPAVALFRETVAGENYILALITPPVVKQDETPTDGQGKNGGGNQIPGQKDPRELIFVIDTSGSMGGASIRQARASLLVGLERLRPGDTFNIIRFSSLHEALFSQPQPVTRRNIGAAKRFVADLEASGGTQMVAPMGAALRDGGTAAARAVRQVVFLTDGAIGNEAELMELVAAQRGRSRVFMVGIGSAPNGHLMSKLAEIGRGSFTHIGNTQEVAERMGGLFAKLEAPVVTGLSIATDAAQFSPAPEQLPDLYRGEPLVVAAKISEFSGAMSISGQIGARPWRLTLPVNGAMQAQGISKLWARRKIRDAEIARRLQQTDRQTTDATILQLALTHGLLSRLTALVAVEERISRSEGVALTRADVPLNLPAGWDFEKVFGPRQGVDGPREERADASGALRKAVKKTAKKTSADDGRIAGTRVVARPAGGAMNRQAVTASARFGGVLSLQAPQAQSRSAGQLLAMHSVRLPKTATDAEKRLLLGLILVVLASLVLVVRRQMQLCFAGPAREHGLMTFRRRGDRC
ncbi:MAG: VIT domain-containing protein [Pseudomonadota bacterium]